MSKRAEEKAIAYQLATKGPNVMGGASILSEDELRFWNINYDFKAGYEEAEKDLGWRSAKDSKPNPSEWVVVCIEHHGTPQCLALATYNEELGKWFTDFEDGEQEEYHPDYWLRIPEFQYK